MEEGSWDGAKLWDSLPAFELNEELDVPELHSWFHDSTHSVPRWTPMFAWFWDRYCGYGSQYVCEVLSIPTSKGWVHRTKDGASYIAMRNVTDEGEIQKRTVKFKQALVPWIDDFDGMWEGYKSELLTMYGRLKAVDLANATNVELMHHLWDLISAYRRMWEIHFLGMYVSCYAFALLEQLVKPFGYTSESPEFQKMFTGFDNKVYQVDKQMWELAQTAISHGLSDVFTRNKSEEVLPELEKSEAGRKWKKGFDEFLQEEGWRMVRMNDLNEPYWLENPPSAISIIQAWIEKGAGYDLDKVRQRLAQEREQAIDDLLEKVPDNEKGWFGKLIDLGGKFSSYSEEHDLYCELYSHALIRRGVLAIGNRLAQAGTIDKPDDVLFLNPDEVEMVMLGPEFHKLQYIANRRRSHWERVRLQETPPVITDRSSMEEAVGMDLLPSGNAIITKLVVGEMPQPRPELKADIYGVCGAPGVAEGPARVIFTYDQLSEVKSGEVLICPGTNPAWTATFGLVKAVVADRGGTLSHAAIVGREYGVPTIVNCFEGTARIKTGMMIRVDATQGAIYFLDK